MFGTILIFICTLLHAYVFWRASSVPCIRRRVSRKALGAWAVGLWAGLVLAMYFGRRGSGAASAMLEFLSMSWLASFFLAAACLLAAELVTGFGFLLRRRAPSIRGWALAAGAGLTAIALVQGIRPPVIRSYEVRLPGLPAALDGTVLVAMSDLHVGSLLGERWLDARVSQVQALRPDVIVLLGDLFEGHGRDESAFVGPLRRLSAPLGVWAVSGNHESHGRRAKSTLLAEFTDVQALHNRWAEVRPGLVLAGVDDLTTARRRTGRGREMVEQALAGRPPGATILLSHTPWETDTAARNGAGLMLCGHTHGGQLWPFSYLVQARYPMLAGRYTEGDMTVIVGRGTGTWGPRMRLWQPGEILRITLRAAPNAQAGSRAGGDSQAAEETREGL